VDRRRFVKGSAALAGFSASVPNAIAQSDRRKELLVVANEFGPNSLDIHTVGANRPSYGVSWICYDRLMTFGKKTLPNGQVTYDFSKLEPELAESWTIAPDTSHVTFRLRKNAKFHDGTPVTARDVKWSFDRAVAVGGFPTFQMAAGSLEKPEQFVVVDDHTFRVNFLRPDKMTMMDMAVPVPSVFNAELVKKNATKEDPWGLLWTKNNIAGGGAYKVESWRPGQEIVYVRNDDWKSGPLPKIRRVIQRDVPNAGTRRALLVKGDIDMTYEMPPKDFSEMAKEPTLKVVSTPIENAMWYVGMNVKSKPFSDVRVRQAVALAVPYDKMNEVAVYGRRSSSTAAPTIRRPPHGRSLTAGPPTWRAHARCSRTPAIRTASRPRCPSTWVRRPPTSRWRCCCRSRSRRSASRCRSPRCPGPTGARRSSRRTCRSSSTASAAG
jgi:peptide/nickel transport system substrate-binding protein